MCRNPVICIMHLGNSSVMEVTIGQEMTRNKKKKIPPIWMWLAIVLWMSHVMITIAPIVADEKGLKKRIKKILSCQTHLPITCVMDVTLKTGETIHILNTVNFKV